MVVLPQGLVQPPPYTMREVLMGYAKDYTHAIWPAAKRRADPLGFELARCSLVKFLQQSA